MELRFLGLSLGKERLKDILVEEGLPAEVIMPAINEKDFPVTAIEMSSKQDIEDHLVNYSNSVENDGEKCLRVKRVNKIYGDFEVGWYCLQHIYKENKLVDAQKDFQPGKVHSNKGAFLVTVKQSEIPEDILMTDDENELIIWEGVK